MAKFIGHPEFRVHTQTGTLLGATKGRMASTSPPRYRLEVDKSVAPHATDVIMGTKIMLGRDVVWDTATAKGTRVSMLKAAIRLLGKGLKTKAALRIAPDSKGSFRMTILAMDQTSVSMRQAAILTTGVIGATLLGHVRRNMSLRDHTLAQLKAAKHPYARRHGSIRIHR